MRIISFYLISLLLISCNSLTKEDNSKHSSAKKVKSDTVFVSKVKDVDGNNELLLLKDSVKIPSFNIDVQLVDSARDELQKIKETIIVWAFLEGEVKDGIPKKYENKVEFGNLQLGKYAIEMKEPGIAMFKDIKIPKELYDLLAKKDITILINVVSGRKRDKDNLLDVEILSNKISRMKGKTFILKGGLIPTVKFSN